MPFATQGALSRFNNEGNTGTAGVTVTAGANGPLAEHDGVIDVVKGGTVGTDQIVLGLSLDGGRVFQMLRVGTANSVAIPFLDVTINLLPGTLVEGDTIYSWHGSAPASDASGRDLARQALAGQQKSFRTVLLCGDLVSDADAQLLLDFANTYETLNERFTVACGSIADRLPLLAPSYVKHVTAGASLTFAAGGQTITRAAGSWLTDGHAVGDVVSVTGTVSNNITNKKITALSATVMTFVGAGIVNEGPISVATVTGRNSLTIAAAGDTVTRNAGSFLTDGFAVGMSVTLDGTVSNDGVHAITALSATVMTFGGSALVDETIGMGLATITQSITKAAWMAAQDLEFASITNAPAISLSAGRARKVSPFSQWNFRRPLGWADSIRSYQHDIHVAAWRKDFGPLSGWDLTDEAGNLVEWDDRVDGKAGVAARFTCARTWANGPVGTFVALSLTRANEGSLLAHKSKKCVVDLICSTVQVNTENAAIGVDLVLNDDGTATTESLAQVESRVNAALTAAVLTDARQEGPRASKAVWTADPSVVFNVPEPEMLGVTDVNLNGTVHSVRSSVRVRTGGN
jgi:hypothetical protein